MKPFTLKLSFALLLLLAATSVTSAAQPPNILIILVDDMGWGDPRCFNPESKILTPHIDRLAAQGMKFTGRAGATRRFFPRGQGGRPEGRRGWA